MTVWLCEAVRICVRLCERLMVYVIVGSRVSPLVLVALFPGCTSQAE